MTSRWDEEPFLILDIRKRSDMLVEAYYYKPTQVIDEELASAMARTLAEWVEGAHRVPE